MKYFKIGDGPLYMFYTPYHLPHLQLPHSVARAVLFQDATLTPLGAPVCDTVSYGEARPQGRRDARRHGRLHLLRADRQLRDLSSAANYLPMALSVDCRLKRAIAEGPADLVRDVELPAGRMCDRLRAEQTEHFAKRRRGARPAERLLSRLEGRDQLAAEMLAIPRSHAREPQPTDAIFSRNEIGARQMPR